MIGMRPRILAATWLAILLAGTVARPADQDRFSTIDRHALRAPKEAERSIESLAKYLVKPAKNDREKVRAIYRWVTDRIAYDAESFFEQKDGDNTAEGVLKSCKAVCAGYANLFHALCKEAGVEVETVSGRAKGVIRDEDDGEDSHAWNAVKLADHWRLVDATWGAGGIREKKFVPLFTDYYFLTPADQFIFTHLPEDSKWQLLPKAITEKEFEELPRGAGRLFKMGVTSEAIRKAMEAKGFRELVKTFDLSGSPITIREAPLQLHLKAGTKCRFRLESGDFVGMAISCEGRSVVLTRKGKVFEGVIVVPQGTMVVQGLQPAQGSVVAWGLLAYVGE
jgi:hypothetical protein